MRAIVPIAAIIAVAFLPADAADFSARIAAAKVATATRPGFIYDTAMVPAIHHALVPCVPTGTDPARGGEFSLVANVAPNGRLSDIAIEPSTPMSRCFARRFGDMRLRSPPGRPSPYPIVVEMKTGR